MMFHMKCLFGFVLFQSIIATPHINLYYTNGVSESDNRALRQNCLYVSPGLSDDSRQGMSYCMSELPTKLNVQKNDFFPIVTFFELSKADIRSEQLYLWSAPIDVAERYQLYLNQISSSNDVTMGTDVFYNCTLPRFGPMCQYEFDHYRPNHASLQEIIRDTYRANQYNSPNMTCYTHLQCNRGPFPSCLDWSEVCDGRKDCLNGDFDEQHCWQLDMTEFKDYEYPRNTEQCRSGSTDGQEHSTPCFHFHEFVGAKSYFSTHRECYASEPSFGCDDVLCSHALTSSCQEQRRKLLFEAMFTIRDDLVSDKCWSAFKCIVPVSADLGSICHDRNINVIDYAEIIEDECPPMLYFPPVPILFRQVYFAYTKDDAKMFISRKHQNPYICSNHSRYDHYFVNSSKVLFNNVTCHRSGFSLVLSGFTDIFGENYIDNVHYKLIALNDDGNYTSEFCNRTNMYQCDDSPKCIPIDNLNDNTADCPFRDDEHGNVPSRNHTHTLVDGIYLCYHCLDPANMQDVYIRRHISFQTICDGFNELVPVMLNGRNETDETECEQWQCDNVYTHCNGLWNCWNGADELGCDSSPPLNCSSDNHICVSPHTIQLMCLPIAKANDNNIDCLGGIDEPKLCRLKYEVHYNRFYCTNQNSGVCVGSDDLCDKSNNCDNGDDEKFCDLPFNIPLRDTLCYWSHFLLNEVQIVICESMENRRKSAVVYFSLDRMDQSGGNPLANGKNMELPNSPFINSFFKDQVWCYRGFELRVWLDDTNNISTTICLCPPSFYGHLCQYQNQRVSLALKFRAFSDSWQTTFAIVITLIDDTDEQIIHSSEQFTYLSLRDCTSTSMNYLLYAARPKNQTKKYAIQVHIYEKLSLTYRGSLLLPMRFPFLPVHRLAFIVDLPHSDDIIQRCFNRSCVHGKCIKYLNYQRDVGFCQCDEGWIGRYCTIPYDCGCALGSVCIGVSADNRSICVCPMHKFGPRCLLTNTVCQINDKSTCRDRGLCIPSDEDLRLKQPFTCICSPGYSGDQCEIEDNEIRLSFEKNIVSSQSLFVHFIQVMSNSAPERLTTFRTNPLAQESVVIKLSRPFHLAFIEMSKKDYYLVVLQKNYSQSAIITKSITASDRCPHVKELFDQSFHKLHLLRQIKYYHVPCQNHSLNLSCFHDDVHLCVCHDQNQKRLANCFVFNHSMTFDCLGQNQCKNDGQCFQDNPDCPRRSMCLCSSCFYGRQCQFSTSGFGLSLDNILGYHVRPNVGIVHQSSIVQVSVALSILFIMAGVINGILALMTFTNKSVREVGCGLYLLGSSITTLLIMIMFGLKFWIFVLAQMTQIKNRSFLQIQCISFDFLLRVCLHMDQWLNACVASERAITVIKETRFVKRTSKQAAKIVIFILLVVNIGTSIHDPIYRRLIDEEDDDNDEKRIWCVVMYSPTLQVYNTVMHTFQFFAPFMINLISAIILITQKSRQQSNLHTDRTHLDILREQYRQHQNLLTAPVLLVILALPRLIISYISKCMKSVNDSWLFLIGYFISFIPPILTFVIFVMPSEFYKKEFHKTVVRYRTNIQRGIQRIL